MTNAIDPLAADAFGGTVEEEQLQPASGTYPIMASGNEDALDADGHDTDVSGFGTVTNVATGHFGVTGGDGSYTYSFNVTEKAAVGLEGGGTLTSDGETVRFHQVDDGSVIGYVDGGGNNGYGTGDRVVFSLGIDTDGGYKFTLYGNVDHPIETSGGAATEDSIKIDLSNIVVAHDGMQPDLALQGSITVIDDTPVAQPETHTVEAGKAATVDIQFIVDRSKSMFASGGGDVDDVPGGYSDDRIGLARYSMEQLLESNTQIEHVQIIRFGGSASGTEWMTRAEALEYVQDDDNWNSSSGTNYDLALQEAMSSYGNGPENPADKSLVYFLSDGEPDGNGIKNDQNDNDHDNNSVTTGEWENHITSHGIDEVYAIGIGGGVSVSILSRWLIRTRIVQTTQTRPKTTSSLSARTTSPIFLEPCRICWVHRNRSVAMS